MKSNTRIVNLLKHAKNFFFSTDDNGQPNVRPFNAVMEFEDKIYLYTNNHNSAYQQIQSNPRVGICAMLNDDRWLKISGSVVFDDRIEAKTAMLDANPMLRKNYSENDKIFEVFYLTNVSAKIHSNYSNIEVIC